MGRVFSDDLVLLREFLLLPSGALGVSLSVTVSCWLAEVTTATLQALPTRGTLVFVLIGRLRLI